MTCECPAFLASAFVEGCPAPHDAGRFVDLRVIEALDCAGLAALDAVERRPELGFRLRSHVVAGRAQTPEHLLTGGDILRQTDPGRSGESNAGNHPYPHHFLLLSQISLIQSAPRLDLRRFENRPS